MANMGSTGTVNITHAMMDAAKQAISDYQATITGLNGELQSEIDGAECDRWINQNVGITHRNLRHCKELYSRRGTGCRRSARTGQSGRRRTGIKEDNHGRL